MTAESDALAIIRRLAEESAPPEDIQAAVNDARDLDASWQSIGDALGIARGNAYQRFRRRPPARHLVIARSSGEDVTMLALRGELDALTAPQLVDAIDDALAQPATVLVIDLLALTFLASAGMTALMEASEHAGDLHKTLRVVAEGPTTRRPLTAMGLDQTFDIYPTRADAMRGLR